MKLRLSVRARNELIAIADYFDERNPAAGARIRKAIDNGLNTLLAFPQSGRPLKIEGVRKFVTQPYPYVIYYLIGEDADELLVLSVCHPARDRGLEQA
jgi:plasmid stabilization system protein ParE